MEKGGVVLVACYPAIFYDEPSKLDMLFTLKYVTNMSKMIQLRNVPDQLHRRLKARAALEGRSLSDYLLAELTKFAQRPTVGELRRNMASRSSVTPTETPAQAVRAERDRM